MTFCKNCKYYELRQYRPVSRGVEATLTYITSPMHLCKHPDMTITDIVTGEEMPIDAYLARSQRDTWGDDSDDNFCGPDAKLFEVREENGE